MELFKKLRQTFCMHHWIPIRVISMDVYNEDDVRYARCKSICYKCNKIKYINYIMASEYQDRLST